MAHSKVWPHLYRECLLLLSRFYPAMRGKRPDTTAEKTSALHALWFQNNVKITDTCPSPLTHSKSSACSVHSCSECLCECKMGHIPHRGISCVKCKRLACQGLLLNYQASSHPLNSLIFFLFKYFSSLKPFSNKTNYFFTISYSCFGNQTGNDACPMTSQELTDWKKALENHKCTHLCFVENESQKWIRFKYFSFEDRLRNAKDIIHHSAFIWMSKCLVLRSQSPLSSNM